MNERIASVLMHIVLVTCVLGFFGGIGRVGRNPNGLKTNVGTALSAFAKWGGK